MDCDQATSIKDVPPSIIAPAPLSAFAAGSFNDEFHLGAWAYVIPELNLSGADTASGKSIRQFELAAVCEALTRLIAHDQSDRPIQVFSDCMFTVRTIKTLKRCIAGLEPVEPGVEEYAEVLSQLIAILQKRDVQSLPVTKRNPHHRTCHQRARAQLRSAIASDPVLKDKMAVKRYTLRLNEILKKRDELSANLRVLDATIVQLQIDIAAISHRCDYNQAE